MLGVRKKNNVNTPHTPNDNEYIIFYHKIYLLDKNVGFLLFCSKKNARPLKKAPHLIWWMKYLYKFININLDVGM